MEIKFTRSQMTADNAWQQHNTSHWGYVTQRGDRTSRGCPCVLIRSGTHPNTRKISGSSMFFDDFWTPLDFIFFEFKNFNCRLVRTTVYRRTFGHSVGNSLFPHGVWGLGSPFRFYWTTRIWLWQSYPISTLRYCISCEINMRKCTIPYSKVFIFFLASSSVCTTVQHNAA